MYPLAILIGGATASGKTKLAFEISKLFPSIIINADSMQVYEDLKILTNRPSKEDEKIYNCKLFGSVSYPDSLNVGLWIKEVKKILSKEKKKIPIFVGGTGLYLENLIEEISPIPPVDPRIRNKIKKIHEKYGNKYLYARLKNKDDEFCKKININDTQRLLRAMEVFLSTGKTITHWQKIKKGGLFKKYIYVVLKLERNDLYEKINKRCRKMVDLGVVKEVASFFDKNKIIKDHPISKAIGLRLFKDFLDRKKDLEQTLYEFSKETRRYAKRQLTWFRNRSKFSINLNYEQAKNHIKKKINNF